MADMFAGMSTLREWRAVQKPKVSQSELASRLATTQSHVSDIEHDEDGVGLELAAKIFAVIGVRLGKLKDATPQQARTIVKAISGESA